MAGLNGAQALLQTLVGAGVTTCFGNPGTSEVQFVEGLDAVPGMRCILALAENVATGAADGYARISGGTATTLLHCGPGLANGLANLHNAQKAGSSIVNLIGDQARFHAPLDPPLASRTEAIARTISAWTRTAATARSVGRDVAEAIVASRAGGGAIASLILPADVCWEEGGSIGAVPQARGRPAIDGDALAEAARVLARGAATALILGDDALRGAAPALAAALADETGARVFAHGYIRRMERGGGRPRLARIPYAPGPARALFADIRHVVLVGARRPVFAFAGPDRRSGPEAPGTTFVTLGMPGDDVEDALVGLCARFGIDPVRLPPGPSMPLPQPAVGVVTPEAFGQSLAALLPAEAIVVDEGVSFGRSAFDATKAARRHDWLQLTGGAIGSGMPLALGAAVAAPGRRVVNLQADGSGLYTVQALWTQARERLPVSTVVFSNRRYEILFNETRRMGATVGAAAQRLFGLDDPAMDWVRLAAGFGVEAARADTMDRFNDLFRQALRRDGPFLIELAV